MESRLRDFIKLLKAYDYSDETIRLYTNAVKDFLKMLNGREITAENADDLLNEYVIYLSDKGLSNTSKRAYLYGVRSFLSKIYHIRPGTTRLRAESRLPKYMTKTEIKMLIDATDNLRDRLLIMLGYEAALRVSEIAKVKVEDFNFHDKTLKIYGKGSKERTIPLVNDDLWYLLERYMDEYDIHEGYLFPGRRGPHLTEMGVEYIFKNVLQKSSVRDKSFSFHSLRHSKATHLMQDGLDTRYIQEFLGHSSIVTTSIYAAVAREDLREKLKKAGRMSGKFDYEKGGGKV